MKRFFTHLPLSLLCAVPVFAQQFDTTATIAEAERKAAHSLMTFSANAHTGNYDMVHQTLDLTADPNILYISGTITTDYIAKEEMSEIVFDLTSQLVVSHVTQNGVDLAYTQNENDELTITLAQIQAANTPATIAVTYAGAPPPTERSFVVNQHAGAPILWTLSEPYGAKYWWPCKQDLIDKIDSIDVYMTAPSQYVSVSNGLELSKTQNGDGTATTHFKHNYPIPAYLVAIAISNYGIFTQQAGTAPNEFPVVNYLYPETQPQNEQNLALTLPIMDFYEERFETYPFHNEKYGHAQCGFGGGMEHTTVSFMGGFSRLLIAHELAHQWFGDKVTCGSWKDIWLNEGFATYISGMVVEKFDGNDAFKLWKATTTNDVISLPDGHVYLTDTDTITSSRIFSSRLTYNKGAMVLHMLRFKLGDTNFFQGVKNYLADPALAYAYAKTPQLQAHLENASGLDLSEFFNDWVYNDGYPSYTIAAENIDEGKAKITIGQTQSHPSVSYFEMPVPLLLMGAEGQSQTVVLDNISNNQEFTVDVPFVVADILFNPENDIVAGSSVTSVLGDYFNPYLTPNPAGSTLTATIADGVLPKEALFFNAIGQKVAETQGQSTWDVSKFANGVYFVILQTTKGTYELKFIKN
ncbi:M1 family aminopeptidase [Flavobacterium sp. DG1-102-2]|uniref:M1 family aminopeptidase n=1 Tax=Flavobacterium sp. DG1-102-2 TaxID=3081663 RepID=UPI00294A361B|nr:M1 family aminopeptidase [Flavobacterium sp. DG1-102-2]MDV6167578.1 M1 family aminopeptidase [Flavobacterium sp. DG1-102-2]